MDEDCRRVLKAIKTRYPHLNFPLRNSPHASVTYNFGPRTVTFTHRDKMNRLAGWCGVFALGDFDHTKGGHIILWDLGLVVEFPPGSLILIPSALVRHANTAVKEHETRYSMTSYTAGDLTRWVNDQFTPVGPLSGEAKKNREKKMALQWVEQMSMFSRIDELAEDIRARL